ncbi:FtsK/SpoIIIE domain-containing protein [Agrococcus carbonis]|uniref:DNA segregation ATPase FtsK/SpoIIIE, S-DNA-T family n=1 Tax=Agrococcus carbonis TaxID=684552 RepID=A0A1H1QJS7_9MICO|nr:FtsK/SpoIIIE domain-containing protein [Agrococcus carbonis]SDS23674.1 DNA segregation ATPase FtsK/SpoIIIE, S-DNA-T family [Agrococcus carbonis]
MKVKLTLHRPAAEPTDVVITADSTATVEDVARQIALADPTRSTVFGEHDTLSLAVAPPTESRLVELQSDALMAEAPIGSGFHAQVVNLGAGKRRGGVAGSAVDAVAVLRAVRGPLRGQEFQLARGHWRIGRDAANDVVLQDPLVSKRHARIEVGAHIEVVDLGSSNGILVDGQHITRLTVIPGQPFTIGESDFVVHLVGSFDASGDDPVLERGGALMFNRSPRVEPRYPGEALKPPRIPKEITDKLFPWPMLMTPILMAGALYAMTGRARSILIAFMTPLMFLGNFINSRRQSGQRQKVEVQVFEQQFEALEERFHREQPHEVEVRGQEAPPVAEVFEQAMRLGPMLWTRRPEHWNFLGLRLGTCRDESRLTIRESEEDEGQGLPQYIERVERLRERFRYVDGVPVFESLPVSGSIGIAGPKGLAADVLRGISVQLFGLHAPNEVVAVALCDPDWTAELDWLKWLPHTTSETSPFQQLPLADSAPAGAALLNALEEHIMRRTQTPDHRGPMADRWTPMDFGTDVERAAGVTQTKIPTSVIVIITNDAPVDRPRLTQILERGADVGVHGVFVAPTVESLPAACRSFVDVTGGLDAARAGSVRAGEAKEGVAVEGVSLEYMSVFAKRLAPVVDSSIVINDSSDIPNAVMLLSLVGDEVAEDPAAVVDRWRQNSTIIDRSGAKLPRLKRAGTLRAVMGQGASDVMTLDLRTQGPHALVGGTTGAGKSEFLQAWVLGMAAAHSPDRVTFLFVDYKGGSAFADCVELPHCVGLVTDLSPHLVRRALTSLKAELHHREHLFNRKKAKDLLELEKRQDPETPPALVLVIDEFAALAKEVPEFVDGVVDIAQRGRSLGIHLIMATQRPAGVIKDNLRANTNLRVALRMADEADSKDVVDDPVAASFDPRIPGRGIAKTGPGRLVPFQSAYAGGWSSKDEVVAAEVRVAELRFGSISVWEVERVAESDAHDEDLGPNDQKRIVQTLIGAAEHAGIPAPRRPWLDDLPTTIDLRQLPIEGDSKVLLGLSDLPQRQQQLPAYFEPDKDGSMLVFGASGAGKSALLKTIGTVAGMRPELGRAEVYGLDFGSGSLRAIERLPHVGSVIEGDDVERVQRLLRSIDREMDRRARAFTAADAANLAEYRDIADPEATRIFVLVDGFPEFRKDWEIQTGRSTYYRMFMRIISEGRNLGVHAVISADRPGSLSSNVSSNISRRVVLRLADPNGYLFLGVDRDVLDDASPAGRALFDGAETQLAIIGGTANVAEQAAMLDELGAGLRERGAVDVEEIGALPTSLSQAELPASVDGMPVFGVAEDTLAPRGFEPLGTFTIVGPPQSGRTTALRSLVAAMVRFDPDVKLFHLGGRRAELVDDRPWVRSAVRPDEVEALAKELAELVVDETIPGRIAIVVEDVAQLNDGPAERAIRALMSAVNNSDHVLFGEADISRAGSSSGAMGEWKAGRQGIALQPDAYDGDSIFKVPFPRVKRSEFPVGRGIFVQHGRSVTMQLPTAPAEVLADA